MKKVVVGPAEASTFDPAFADSAPVIYCFGNTEEITLLDYRWIRCVLLLGEDR